MILTGSEYLHKCTKWVADDANCVHTCNPGGRTLTCPQPGALHTKGRSSPIFANSLQCNCGREEEENIVAALLQFVSWQILKTTKQGCCGLSSSAWAGSQMLFKNNPGKEENMHIGSETKFPWWYFLHTWGFWLANEESRPRELSSYHLHNNIYFSFCLFSPFFFCQSLLLSLALPLLTFEAPPKILPSHSTSSAFNSFSVHTNYFSDLFWGGWGSGGRVLVKWSEDQWSDLQPLQSTVLSKILNPILFLMLFLYCVNGYLSQRAGGMLWCSHCHHL